MPLESATYVSDLVVSNPASSDPLSAADGQMRLIKSVLKNTLQGFTGALTSATGQLTPIDGTSTAPGHAFASETALGIYRLAAGEMGIAGRLVGQGAVPIGALIPFAGNVAPAGYLSCDGQAVSRTTYSELYAIIGTTWGAGDGSTTFNVPNLLDRYTRHRNINAGNRAGAIGTLQADVFATHTHTYSGNTGTDSVDHTHTFSGNTGPMNSNAAHTHTYNGSSGSTSTPGGSFACAPTSSTQTTSATNIDHLHAFSGTTSNVSALHTHAYNGTTAATGDPTETRPLSASVLVCIRAL